MKLSREEVGIMKANCPTVCLLDDCHSSWPKVMSFQEDLSKHCTALHDSRELRHK